MTNEKEMKKLRKKCERTQFFMKLFVATRRKSKGNKRFHKTSHGEVKVYEYGFDSTEITPLFIDLHGGGFVLGAAELDEEKCVQFWKKANIRVVNIDYPKAPKHPFPAAIEAIYEIIKHYVQNAEGYKIDPERVGIGGHSAGGNLSAAICIKAKETGDLSFKLQVLNFPPLDMTIDPFTKKSPKGSVKPDEIKMYNVCYFNNDIEIAKSPYLSPVYATKGQLTGLPPALLIVAGQDSLRDEGIRYGEMLKAAGVDVEFHEFKDSVHGFTYYRKSDAKKGISLMADYIRINI